MSDPLPVITLYTSPFCGYCGAAKRLLGKKGVEVVEVDVLFDPERRREMIERSHRQTVPQVFVGDRHLGGYEELQALDARGELDALLEPARTVSNR
jgi:glutaredoxin 3